MWECTTFSATRDKKKRVNKSSGPRQVCACVRMCACACVRMCAYACVRLCACACVCSPPGGGLAQSVYSCTPPVRRGRRAGSLSYSFTQLDCDCSLLNYVAFCAYPLQFSFRLWRSQKVLSRWISWNWREIKQVKHYTVYLGLYLNKAFECAKLDHAKMH